jgi:hypothetical protein
MDMNVLVGKTLTKVIAKVGSGCMELFCSDGTKYEFYHEQECCEDVSIEDICGDLNNLIGTPLLMAEDISASQELLSIEKEVDSCTWTFYKFATVKGYVTVRWFGESNGYYSESVDFVEIQ